MRSCWLGAFDSESSAVREGRCEKAAVGRARKEASSSPSLIRKSTELAADTEGTNKVSDEGSNSVSKQQQGVSPFHQFLRFRGIS